MLPSSPHHVSLSAEPEWVAGEASSAAPGPHLRRMHPCCRHGRAYMALERLWIQSVTQLSGLEEVFGDLRLDQVVLIQRL